MTFRSFSAFVLLLIVYMGTQLYDNTPLRQAFAPKIAAEELESDFYMENARLSGYSKEGPLDFTLDSEHIAHYPHDDTLSLSRPKMLGYQDKGDYLINAQQGKVFNNGDQVDLWEGVEFIQEHSQNNSRTQVLTEFISLYPNEDLATTDKAVAIIKPWGTTEAVGMRAELGKQRIKLHSKVDGNYAQP